MNGIRPLAIQLRGVNNRTNNGMLTMSWIDRIIPPIKNDLFSIERIVDLTMPDGSSVKGVATIPTLPTLPPLVTTEQRIEELEAKWEKVVDTIMDESGNSPEPRDKNFDE